MTYQDGTGPDGTYTDCIAPSSTYDTRFNDRPRYGRRRLIEKLRDVFEPQQGRLYTRRN